MQARRRLITPTSNLDALSDLPALRRPSSREPGNLPSPGRTNPCRGPAAVICCAGVATEKACRGSAGAPIQVSVNVATPGSKATGRTRHRASPLSPKSRLVTATDTPHRYLARLHPRQLAARGRGMRDSQINGMGTSLRGCECQSLSTLANDKRSDELPTVPDSRADDEIHIQRHDSQKWSFRPVGPDGMRDRPSRRCGVSA